MENYIRNEIIFKNGDNKINNRIGKMNYTKYGTPMCIIGIINNCYVEVEFLDQHRLKKAILYSNFNCGSVKNPYDKSVSGVGFLGEGKYMAKVNNSLTTTYVTWRNMMHRCYNEERRYLHPAYESCIICEEWHNFQIFAKWYEENFYQVGKERMHIDKDILINGNSIYSPETCLIVPQRINMIFMKKSRNVDCDLSTGINRSESGKFMATYNGKSLGTYESIDECLIKYNDAKYVHIISVAEEYKKYIPRKLYDALYNWVPNSLSIVV